MKISKSFRFSEEAAAKLEEQDNATQYLEDLILGNVRVDVPWLNLEARIDELKELLEDRKGAGGVLDLGKPVVEEAGWNEVGKSELLCCSKKSPCRHWMWDGTKDGYTNSITGEFRGVV